MAFDKEIPINGALGNADPIRGNFNSLAIHHRGATAPTSPDVGWIWWDSSDSNNEKLKSYYGGAWAVLFNHMESTPVPASSSGGGLEGRLALIDVGSDDGLAQQVTIAQDACRMFLRVFMWYEPYAGGLFGANWGSGPSMRIYPTVDYEDAVVGYNTFLVSTFGPYAGGKGSMRLTQPAALGDTTLYTATLASYFTPITKGYNLITDGVNPVEQIQVTNAAYTDAGATGVLTLAAPGIQKVGGYAVADEIRGVYYSTSVTMLPWADFADDDSFFVDFSNPGSIIPVWGTPWRVKGHIQYYGV